MDLVTLALAKKYTDKKIGQNSGAPSDENALQMLIQMDMLPAVTNKKGAILTDENKNIILKY